MPVAVLSKSPRIALIFLIVHSKERELAALHCPDTNMLEMRLDDGTDRQTDELSGGQR